MEIINFNKNFTGFKENEDILIDTGIIIAYANKYDRWHETVVNLFNDFILNNENEIYFYVNPIIINEVTHLADKRPITTYLEHHPHITFSFEEINDITEGIIQTVKDLIELEIVDVIDGNIQTTLKQLKFCRELGSADSANISMVDGYEMSFLTLDNRLINNVKRYKEDFLNIQRIYFTTPNYQSY